MYFSTLSNVSLSYLDSVFLKDISASSTLNLEDFTSLVKSLELRSKKVCGRDGNTALDEAIKVVMDRSFNFLDIRPPSPDIR